ncbi:MAG: hypothetical protein ACLQDM_02085 [Bradyrhizobium sp.]
MSDSAQTPAAKSPPAIAKSAGRTTSSRRPIIVAAVGGLLIVAAIGLVLRNADIGISGNPAQPTVSFVAQRDLGEAATTLTPSAAGALVDDAQRCKIPLASMTIAKGTAAIGSTLRIRSGSYVSPYFTVTENMQRIAVPYPAPYGSGAGTFVVEGNASGAVLGLTPTRVLIELPGAQSIPVVWRAVNPC